MKWYKGKRIYLRRINIFLELFGFQIKKILDLKHIFKDFRDFALQVYSLSNINPSASFPLN